MTGHPVSMTGQPLRAVTGDKVGYGFYEEERKGVVDTVRVGPPFGRRRALTAVKADTRVRRYPRAGNGKTPSFSQHDHASVMNPLHADLPSII